MKKSSNPICQYCKNESELVTGRSIYPCRTDLFDRYFYLCEPCFAYVGCHRASKKRGVATTPLGILANAELRQAKKNAHKVFDKMWVNGPMKRWVAYAWLAKELNIDNDSCHIGMFNLRQCELVIKICTNNAKMFPLSKCASDDNSSK